MLRKKTIRLPAGHLGNRSNRGRLCPGPHPLAGGAGGSPGQAAHRAPRRAGRHGQPWRHHASAAHARGGMAMAAPRRRPSPGRRVPTGGQRMCEGRTHSYRAAAGIGSACGLGASPSYPGPRSLAGAAQATALPERRTAPRAGPSWWHRRRLSPERRSPPSPCLLSAACCLLPLR
jgi:hypothetical protein